MLEGRESVGSRVDRRRRGGMGQQVRLLKIGWFPSALTVAGDFARSASLVVLVAGLHNWSGKAGKRVQ